MKVGVKIATEFQGMASMQRIYSRVYEALVDRHELVFLPHGFPYAPEPERRRMAEEFLGSCDVFVGLIDAELLAARRRLGSGVPFVILAMGTLPMGGWHFRQVLGDLTSRDVLLVACESDVKLAEKLFRNARARVAPFSCDHEAFHALGEREVREARRAMGFADDARILLYAGRIMPEKNVHTVLRIFRIVSSRVPNVHLVLSGEIGPGAMQMCNVHTPRFSYSFLKAVEKLELPPQRTRLVGQSGAQRLRELYNMADVKVNMTLNPDENFGLAQVEAMACGTPVVGTAWGGLKDTIVDGETGYRVSTVVTPSGIKIDWWEAANRVVSILQDDSGRERMRDGCLRQAARYTRASFAALMETIVRDAREDRGPAEPLQPTRFAEEFWAACDPRRMNGAAVREGADLERMYRSLLAPYAAVSPAHVPMTEFLAPGQVVSLATPVEEDGEAGLRPDNPLHPFRVRMPPAHQAGVRAILAVMRREPVLAVEALTEAAGGPAVSSALWWMVSAGLVLRTRPLEGWMAPDGVDSRAGEALFAVQQLERESADVVVF